MPHLSVGRNAAFCLELAGVDQGERERRALAALEQVGLASWADCYRDELSGGMRNVSVSDLVAIEYGFQGFDHLWAVPLSIAHCLRHDVAFRI